ncbi:ubiquitin domain-containing protein UBFD1-like isoform X2 [Convolutriloba macropyga]|uniref:ubiquitin domain-containing protein UBFD1-like isoform X2 n=1 Tax=Convolutriloba macropyga TaxID=536237 RepID=UPI003F522E89
MSDNCEGQKSEENRVGSVQDGAVVGAAEENEMNGDIHTGTEPDGKKARTSLDSKVVTDTSEIPPPVDSKENDTELNPAEDSSQTGAEVKGSSEEALDVVKEEEKPEEFITIKVAYNKTIYDTKVSKSKTVLDLKMQLQKSTGVPESLQKLMYKGMLTDNTKIANSSLVEGCKVLLIGSKVSDVVQVNKVPTKTELLDDPNESKSREPLCQQTQHKKVIDKGKPENLMPGVKNIKESLPQNPLSGMIKQDGGNVRLTFKLESDELWIGTKERTHKLPMNSIKSVHSEAIKDHEEYSIVGIQTGPTVKSTIWVYWVPSQYVDAIKDTILGSFLF